MPQLHENDAFAEAMASEEPQSEWGKPPDLSAYFTPAQAAKELGVSRQAVNKYLNAGILPTLFIMGSRVTSKQKVLEYKANRRENRAAK